MLPGQMFEPVRRRRWPYRVLLGLLLVAGGGMLVLPFVENAPFVGKSARKADYLKKGKVYFEAGRFREAEIEFRNALQLDPDYAQAYYDLGLTDLATGAAEAAREALKQSAFRAPNRVATQVKLGEAYILCSEPQEALAAFERALALNANAVEALVQVCRLLVDNGHSQLAVTRCAEQLTRAPRNAAMHLLMGSLLLDQGQDVRAEQSLRQALALDAGLPHAHFLLGTIFERRGAVGSARMHYERALALDPDFAEAANNLAWLTVKQGGDLEKARSLAEMARQKLSDRPDVLDTLGWVYYKMGRFDRAVRLLETCATQAPDNAIFRYHLGMAYYKNGAIGAAHEALSQSLVQTPATAMADSARAALTAMRLSEGNP